MLKIYAIKHVLCVECIQCCVQFRVCQAFADGNLCPVVTLWTATNTPLLRHFSIFLSSLPLLHPLSSCPPPPCSPPSPPRSAPLSPSPPGPWPPPMWSDNSLTIQRFGPQLSEPFICAPLQDGGEQVFRPSNVQSKRMDDVGTRSIFTPEQVGPHLNNLERDVTFLCGRTCSGSQ